MFYIMNIYIYIYFFFTFIYIIEGNFGKPHQIASTHSSYILAYRLGKLYYVNERFLKNPFFGV